MYKLRLNPEQVRGVSPTEYNVIAAYLDKASCSEFEPDPITIKTIVQSDVADFIRLDCDSGIATVLGSMKDNYRNPIVQANPGDVVEFPCGCIVELLDEDWMEIVFGADTDLWDVEYASVHVIDER